MSCSIPETETQQYLNKMIEIQTRILKYLTRTEEDIDFDYEMKKRCENCENLKEYLLILAKIAKNHHRTCQFFTNIEKILIYLKSQILQNFSNSEIFKIFKGSNRVLFFLFQKQIIKLDEFIISQLVRDFSKRHYFSPEIQSHKPTLDFDEKRKKGENDDEICRLIRDDLIDEFIIYVNQTGYKLKSKVKSSIFETNSFLIHHKPTLIEYSAFFGSVQIFKYMLYNNVELTPSLWTFAIHSNNAELLHLLEEKKVIPEDNSFGICLEESIKCHHNGIANYIEDNKLSSSKQGDKIIYTRSLKARNYALFPNDLKNNYFFYYLCKKNYIEIVKSLLKSKGTDFNTPIIQIKLFYTIL